MMRIALCLTLAAGFAASLAAWASAETAFSHSYRMHHARRAYTHLLTPAATPQDLASPQFYGPFGGYADAFAASRYSGANGRHYFGYGGPDQPTGSGFAMRSFWHS